jgi:CRP/FNR family transcriptional regulator
MSRPSDPLSLFIARLRESPFFESGPDSALFFLSKYATHKHYQAGETIFWEGESSLGLYWLQSGTLKAVKYSTSGREQIIHLINLGQTFNEVGAFTKLPNPASIVALSPSQVWRIPGEAIRQLIQRDPEFAQLIIEVLAQRLHHSVALIEDLSLRPVINRLSRLILDEADGDTLFRPTWYTQNELAARLGTVADVIQRGLRRLEAENLIQVERWQILILDRKGLEKMVE